MFHRLGSFVSRYYLWVLLGWLLAGLAVALFAPAWDDVTRDGDFAYLPEQMTSVRGEKLLEAAFPDIRSKSAIVLVLSRPDGPLRPADYTIADDLVARYEAKQDTGSPIVGVMSHRTPVVGEKLRSAVTESGQGLLIVLQLSSEFMAIGNMPLMEEILKTVEDIRSGENFPAGLKLGVSGSAAIGADMRIATVESIRNTELTTIVLVILILLVVYRAPGLVLVPLVAIATSVIVATGVVASLAGLSAHFDAGYMIFKETRIFVVVLLFGAGVDFCLFLIARFKEELERGLVPADAISHALGQVGHAVVGSAFTTVVGLGLMAFAAFGKFKNSGPTIALCLFVALVSSLTLAPALLRAVGPIVFWPFGVQRRRAPTTNGSATFDEGDLSSAPFRWLWERLSRQILARPGLILVGSVILLAPVVYHGWDVEVTYDFLSELPPNRPSVQGTELLRQHFSPGETSPVTILAYREEGGLENSKAGRERTQQVIDQLYALTYRDSHGNEVKPITSVRSWVEPLGQRARGGGFWNSIEKSVIRNRTRDTYLAQGDEFAGKVTRLDVVFQYDPFSLESIRLLNHVQSQLEALSRKPESSWHGAYFYYLGTTAGIRDLREVTSADRTLIQQLVSIGVLAVLIVLLRRPWVCLYLIFSVLVGYFFTMGTTELVFSWLYGSSYHGLDWKVPVFLFVILIAVGQDYNIFLATRVFEEQRRRGIDEGMRVALIRTGGIITSCGVIMAGTFISMTTGTLRAMVELGFALAFGVLLDTFVIRTILVPAFLIIWDRYWMRRRLARQPAEQPVGHGRLPLSGAYARGREGAELMGGAGSRAQR